MTHSRAAALSSLLLFLASGLRVLAHEHHEGTLTEGQKQGPIDNVLLMHMFLQAGVWGILFPAGMVLGLSRSRWHVPVQSVGFALTAAGFILGHSHGGRAFPASAHGKLANIMLVPMIAQFVLGVYLKLHIHEETIRPYFVKAHGILGKSYPIWGWIQMLFGAIVLRGYCRGGNLNQCLAHYIMGSGFIAYAVIMAIILLVGENWVRRSGRSPDLWDSAVIMVWGIVNTFTEHWGNSWSAKDMQHTILGVLWWTGGILGVYLSRNNQRSIVPSLILVFTGWAMAGHAQSLMISTKVHSQFGYTLGSAGIARLIEVCFVAPKYTQEIPIGDAHSERTLDADASRDDLVSGANSPARAFRHLPPFLLVASGVLFMSATDEEMRFTHGVGMDHVTYILIMYSTAFLLYFIIVALIGLYANSGKNAAGNADTNEGAIELVTPRNKWYSPVPNGEQDPTHHVIGDDD